jgi:hypothetical protein
MQFTRCSSTCTTICTHWSIRYVTGQKCSGILASSVQGLMGFGRLPSLGNRTWGDVSHVTTVENLITYRQGCGAQV